MMHAIQHPSGQSASGRQTASPVSAARRTVWGAAWLAVPALALFTAGCGGGTDKKPKQSTTVAQNESQDDEKDAPAPAPAPKKKQKQKLFDTKPAEAEAPPPSTTDVRKWKGDDLNAALLRKDVMFVAGVLFYSATKPNDAKRAEELDSLVKKVARLKDDPVPEVPIPAGAFAALDVDPTEDGAAKPGTAAAATPAARPGGRMGGPFRMGGGRAGRAGDGGK